MYSTIVFDLDGTLAESKQKVSAEMAEALSALSKKMKVCIISGGDWPQYQKQLLPSLSPDSLENILCYPTCASKMYSYEPDYGWIEQYAELLTESQIEKIYSALRMATQTLNIKPEDVWGLQIENRSSQVTFSALGQEAPLKQKQAWDPDFAKRKAVKKELELLLPEFSIKLGGSTSIDVTLPGIDKAYGIKKISEFLDFPLKSILFVGDAIFPDGNDFPVTTTECQWMNVNNPLETLAIIKAIIANF